MPEQIDTAQIRDLYLPNRDIPAHWDGPRTIRDLCDALDAARNDIRVLDDALDDARAELVDQSDRRMDAKFYADPELLARAESAEGRLQRVVDVVNGMGRFLTGEAVLKAMDATLPRPSWECRAEVAEARADSTAQQLAIRDRELDGAYDRIAAGIAANNYCECGNSVSVYSALGVDTP